MLTKPDSCRGCPLWGDGKGFVPDELIEGAPTLVIGQNPGESEETEGRPFVGKTGEAMMRHYFPLAGLERGVNVSIGNIIRCRYQNSNELPKLGTKDKLIEQAIEHCTRAHLRIPSGAKLIVVQGAYALWGLTGEKAISEWRGWLLPVKEGVLGNGRGLVSVPGTADSNDLVCGSVYPGANERVGEVRDDIRDSVSECVGADHCNRGVSGVGEPGDSHQGGAREERAIDAGLVNRGGDRSTASIYHPGAFDIPVLATLHLAALFRNPELQLPTRLDWIKARRYLAGEWPKRLPPIQDRSPKRWPELSAFDTEYTYPGPKRLLRYNLATPERDVYVVEAAQAIPYRLPTLARVVMHNAIADLGFLYHLVRPASSICVEDTMLAHSVLWSGMGRENDEASRRGAGFGQGLDFLGSMYASINRWKHLAESNPISYAAGDAVATLDLWRNIEEQFRSDPQSEWVYRNCVLPLLPIIAESEKRGLRVNKPRVREVATDLEETVREAELRAQSAAGWPISLASPQQVAYQLYELERVGR